MEARDEAPVPEPVAAEPAADQAIPRMASDDPAASGQPDPDIESIVALQPAQPAAVGALAAGLHARLGKPLRWFGRQTSGAPWQLLASDSRGAFVEFAACLLLADRNGAASRAATRNLRAGAERTGAAASGGDPAPDIAGGS